MFTTFALSAVILASAATESELTIYNGGYALVKEKRNLSLKKGMNQTLIEDVAQMIEANSVGVRALAGANRFNVLEQSYRYDLVSVQAILARAVGQPITFQRVLGNGQRETVRGTLLSAPNAIVSDENGNQTQVYNGMVIRTDDGKILLNPEGTVQVESLPAGLASKPSLAWLLDSSVEGNEAIELSYLTKGFSWKSDYVLSLDADGLVGDLKGWVTVSNNSGTSYEDAKLKFLAGEVNRAEVARPRPSRAAPMMEMKSSADMAEEQFGEYHLYTLPRPATLANREIKQLNLLEAGRVKAGKLLLVDAIGSNQYYPNEGEIGTGVVKPVVYIEIENNKNNQLGMPLPAGTFKVFQRSKSGSLELLGEDAIQHTPKNEKLKLKVGTAFDILAERKRTKYSQLSPTRVRQTFEIQLRNRKETEETVTVWERHWGDHKITQSSMEGTWLDANTLQFKVKLGPDEVKTVTYTIETKW